VPSFLDERAGVRRHLRAVPEQPADAKDVEIAVLRQQLMVVRAGGCGTQTDQGRWAVVHPEAHPKTAVATSRN
jgi:hypothetical protein